MTIGFINKEVVNTWIDEDESEESINRRYKKIDDFNQKIYGFVYTFYDYFKTRRNYGNNHKFTMIEAHVLTDINDNAGITVSELADKGGKTISALSQTVRKLIKRGYVERVNDKEDAKVFFLFATEEGKEFAYLHKRYDVIDTIKVIKRLLKKFSQEEVATFFEVLEEYKDLLVESMDKAN